MLISPDSQRVFLYMPFIRMHAVSKVMQLEAMVKPHSIYSENANLDTFVLVYVTNYCRLHCYKNAKLLNFASGRRLVISLLFGLLALLYHLRQFFSSALINK